MSNDDIRYLRRWADDVRAEYAQAMRRREFFAFWQPQLTEENDK